MCVHCDCACLFYVCVRVLLGVHARCVFVHCCAWGERTLLHRFAQSLRLPQRHEAAPLGAVLAEKGLRSADTEGNEELSQRSVSTSSRNTEVERPQRRTQATALRQTNWAGTSKDQTYAPARAGDSIILFCDKRKEYHAAL